MDKRALIEKVVAQLRDELELLLKAARAAHSEATHESSKAENKYDTRGLEASYLARGQSKQAAEAVQAIQDFEALPARAFAPSDSIELGALVEVSGKREHSTYFIGPRAGGTEVTLDGQEIMVITPQSPLGQQLVGRRQGDKLKLSIGGTTNDIKIASVS